MKFKIYFIYAFFNFFMISNFIKCQNPKSVSVFDIIDTSESKKIIYKSEQHPTAPEAGNYRFTQPNVPPPILGPPIQMQVSRPNINVKQNFKYSQASNNGNNFNNAGNNIQMMLDKIKSKVTNPFLKNNFTIDNIANFFANFIAGNEFINNLEVKELADINKLEVKESLKVKNEAIVENLSFNKLKSRAMTIDDNEIIFDPEAVLKLKTSKIAFNVKDVFEVITFMKYIVKICGSKLEKCDFNSLLKNRNANQLMQLISAFEKKQHNFLEVEKEKIKKESAIKNEVLVSPISIPLKLPEEVKANINKIKSNSYFEKKEKNLRKEQIIEKVPNFKQKEEKSSLEDIEKELSKQINFGQNNLLNEDYENFLRNPQMANYMNNYYYDINGFNNSNN